MKNRTLQTVIEGISNSKNTGDCRSGEEKNETVQGVVGRVSW